ncbi:MAG TPA: GNAT family N-acetyltransferase [Bryobacteraceae bacterium]|nr:GNAT family N-acetyltransferase [Bryobacteraceae bacterium]
MARGEKAGRRIEIETLTTEQQFRDAVALQKMIWGFDEIELLPVRLFVVATKVGGQAYGAYVDGRMVAFCLAIPGLKPGAQPYLHSHMLGVLPDYRDLGVGRLLKLRQREDAIARGIELIEWTFDPLELKNAYFNVERLGAIVRRYVRNQYGTTTSHLHGGLPTDRCTAEWWVSSERVRNIVNGEPFENPPILERIRVPADIADIRRKDPKRARLIQEEMADQFESAFRRGLAVVNVDRTPEWGTYLLAELP